MSERNSILAASALFVSSTLLFMSNRKCSKKDPRLYVPLTACPVATDSKLPRPYFTSDPSECLTLRTESVGANSLPPLTIANLFRDSCKRFGKMVALAVKRKQNGVLPKSWRTWTFQQYWDESLLFAKAMLKLGIKQHAAINILGFNSPEWFISNMGSILIGCIPAGLYTTNNPGACLYISRHSEANLLVVDGLMQLSKYCQVDRSQLPSLQAIVVWGDEPVDPATREACGFPVFTWNEFLQLGAAVSTSEVDSRLEQILPGQCATLIYTSGTTGPPKAVMLSNDNITWTCQVFSTEYVVDGTLPGRVVSYLPLSHIAAQMIDIHYGYYCGNAIYFAQPDALKGSLSVTLKEVRPTVFFGVPRVWEKMEEKLKEIGKQSSGIKKILATWAKDLGFKHCQMAQFGADNENGTPWGYAVARILVLKKIKEALGLDQCRAYFTAAAPIAVETLHYFASLDIALYELFGQSESTGPHTSSKFGQWKFGYCGRPLPGTYTKIDPANHELCYRGRHIFMGYAHMPEETQAAFDSEGYLKSGDVAEFDDNNLIDVPPPSGFMRITGRIKELIITAGGENIPPTIIEAQMKVCMPALSNCVVIGDRRKFLGMLVTLKCEVNADSGEPTDELTQEAVDIGHGFGSSAKTVSAAMEDPLWTKYIDAGVAAANKVTTSRAQVVQKWKLLPVDFSEKQGQLTPTLKIKRKVVSEMYTNEIEALFADK